MSQVSKDIKDMKEKQEHGAYEPDFAVPLSEVVRQTLRHWQWLVVSVCVCLGFAALYVLRTPKTYTRSAEIVIKDDKAGASSSLEEFADMGIFQTNSNVYNEAATLRSKDMAEEVVRRLGLDVSYSTDGLLKKNQLFGSTLPVKVTVPKVPDTEGVAFDLDLQPSGAFVISRLKLTDAAGEERAWGDREWQGVVGKPVGTPAGPVFVTKGKAAVTEPMLIYVDKRPVKAVTRGLVQRLSIENPNKKEGSVISMRVTDVNTERGDAILDMLIQVYNEGWINEKNRMSVSTSRFIDDRLAVIESELGNVDSDISEFKSRNLMPDVGLASQMYMERNEVNSSKMLDISTQLQIAQYIKQYLAADREGIHPLPFNSGVQNQVLARQIEEYNQLVLERAALASKSSDRNPLVAALDAQIVPLRRAIAGTADNIIRELSTQLRSLERAESEALSKISSNPTQARYLLSVERQQKVKEQLYLFLLQKREENELSQAFTAYNTRVITRPGDSGKPAKPSKGIVFGAAFILGLFIPFGVTYVREVNNTRLRGRSDVEDLATPFLGEIPEDALSGGKRGFKGRVRAFLGMKRKFVHNDGSPREVVVKEGSRNLINESFRVLRTNVEFMRGNSDRAEVMAITSFNAGSGKSYIAMNLAKVLALRGRRVLVIDGDMRHGSASQYVGKPAHGLSDYLSGRTDDLASVTVCRDENRLCVLPVGKIPPNPAELLEGERFPELLEKERGRWDYIIIDCPPIEIVADTQIINRYVDRTIFVLRAGLLERALLPELDRLYATKKYKNISFILNGTDTAHTRYGYKYGYGYGYGYGYAYTYGDKGTKS